MKAITIAVSQEQDGRFRVASFTNTAELTVGLVVNRDRLARWVNLPHVTVRVVGMTPEASATEDQPDLLLGAVDKNASKRSPVRKQSASEDTAMAK